MDALASGYGLIEGPVWDDDRGLLFADVMNGGVRALDSAGNVADIVPKRRGIGGMALHADGGLILGGREIIWQPTGDADATTLLDNSVTDEAIGFNDLTTDEDGRIWVGSLAFRVFAGEPLRPGHLHVIDLDGTIHTVSDDVTLTNGLGFSPDGRTLYHSDSRRNTVRAYDVTGPTSVSPWRAFATIEGGIPDGLAVAEDGSVWVAIADGGRVAVFNPDGSLRENIAVPLPMVTSVCFGGDGLRDLYIVTGSRGGPHDNCGSVYRLPADVAGLPLPPCRVRPS
ncbi:MAG: SMP-30/gluconolactonase/LRE family protein [Pseudomonadota bacterium]